MTVKVYVEGGGDHNKALDSECRRGFSEFFRKAGLEGRMPRVVACGGRQQAYDAFRTAHTNAEAGSLKILLVDSEAPVVANDPWEHVRLRPAMAGCALTELLKINSTSWLRQWRRGSMQTRTSFNGVSGRDSIGPL